MAEKVNAIVEFSNLKDSGRILLKELVSNKWKSWENNKMATGVVEKGILKKWEDRKLVEHVPSGNVQKIRVFNAILKPAQEIEYYDRAAREKKTGPVSEVELSISQKDFSVIVSAIATKALEVGVKNIKLEGFAFEYQMGQKKVKDKFYKVLKSAKPLKTAAPVIPEF